MAELYDDEIELALDEDEDDECGGDDSIEETIAIENIKTSRKLDFSLKTPQERTEFVKRIVDETPPEQLTPKYLEILADYIIFAMDKEERKQRKILTDNRMVTVNNRETSYQGLVSKFENGEDGIYNMITNDKNILFTIKNEITQKDLDEIPELKKLHDEIIKMEKIAAEAKGKRKYLIMKQIIEMRKDQYVIKNAYRKPIRCMNLIKSFSKICLDEKITFDAAGEPVSDGYVSFFEPKHVSALLCNYVKLKEDSWGNFQSDSYYMMEDLDNLIDKTLKEKYPLYYDLVIYKIDGKQNIEIQQLLEEKHGIKHSVEYISSLWRNKIPKLIAETAKEDYIMWHYTTQERGKWKRCSRCGEIKLAHNRFFSKNKTSKDGYYSICKDCRNHKTK